MFISSSTSFRRSQLSSAPTWPTETSAQDHFNLADVVSFFKRYWITITLPMVITLAACTLYLKVATPIFTARAQVIIDPRVQEQWNGQTGNAVLALDTAQVESQIAVLRSERIAKSVIADLNLADAEDFQPRPSLMRRLLAPVWPVPPIEMSPAARSRFIMESFASNLDVRRSGMSYAIDITFSSPSPDRAAQVANATAEAYIRYQLAARSETARVGGDWLEARTLELRNQMSAATRAVQEFKARRDYRIVRSGDGRPGGAPDAAAEAEPKNPANTLEELETTAQIYQRVYESFLQGFTEAVQRQSFPVADAHVLTSATAPFFKTQPRGTMILALGLLVSGLVGGGIALLRHQLDNTIRSARQIRSELGIECIGSFPVLAVRARRPRPGPSRPRGAPASTQVTTRRPLRSDSGYFTAAFRPSTVHTRNALVAIRERIEICMRPAERFSFGVTSHSEGEGKSMLASNLASLFALSGRRTLIVDANPQHPTLSTVAGASPRLGLMEVVAGLASLEQALRTLPDLSVDVLPIGCTSTLPAIFHQDDTTALRMTIGSMLNGYDVVIFDLPPMTPSHGEMAVYLCLDCILLAVEAGKTTRGMIEEDIHWLQTLQAKVLGAVVTKSER